MNDIQRWMKTRRDPCLGTCGLLSRGNLKSQATTDEWQGISTTYYTTDTCTVVRLSASPKNIFCVCSSTHESHEQKLASQFWSFELHESAKRFSGLSIVCCRLAQSSVNPLCAYKPICFGYTLVFAMTKTYCMRCEYTCVENDTETIIWRAPRQRSMKAILGTVCTTVSKSVISINYHTDESKTTVNYYLPVFWMFRDETKPSCRWVCNE